MCSLFGGGDNTVNQTQTYRPNPQVAGAISGALNQAQGVAQTPFQTPVAPVAGFSGQQNQAFNLANSVPGAAQPWINEAGNFLSGQNVGNFYNPFASNVMANLKDVFGQQMSDTTGKLQQAAGGVGADRIAVGQSELAKQQGLVAGQTMANLWQPALAASQNAGYGYGQLGQLNQSAQMQGVNQLLTTGGLQQQLQQAQMNAPYQNQLAAIQWPYQNSQFLTSAVAGLAPGMGGTTSGQTTYPQQSPLAQYAGPAMLALGMAGGPSGVATGVGSAVGNAYGAATGWNPAGIAQGPSAATGGRVYADGGAVDDSLYDNSGISDDPINVAAQPLIPQSQITPMQANIPKLPELKQPSEGGGGDMMAMAMKFLPMLMGMPPMAHGGRINPYGYASGGRAYDPGGQVDEDTGFEGLRRLREAMDITRLAPPMLDLTAALMGLGPRGTRMWQRPNSPGTYDLQVNNRFASRNAPAPYHPAREGAMPVGAANLARFADPLGAHMERRNVPMRREIPEDSSPMIERPAPEPADAMFGQERPMEVPADFGDRWGALGEQDTFPERRAELPPEEPANPFAAVPERIPLPRPKPRNLPTSRAAARRALSLDPRDYQEPLYFRHATGFQEGGEVFGSEFEEPAPEETLINPFTRRQAALEEADPFERAALRTRESVRPTGGRQDGPLLGAAGTALLTAAPQTALLRYAPKAGAALYGLMGGMTPTQAGDPETFQWTDSNKDRLNRLNKIDADIALESGRQTKSAPGTQKARIDSLNAEKQRLLAAQDTDKNLARQDWEAKQTRLRDEASAKKKAETSLFDVIPGTRAALTAASPFASYFGGKYLGKRLSPWAAVPVGATTGALEGAASIGLPTEVDINTLPESSPTRQQAQASLSDPDYYKRLALAAGVSGAFGGLGAVKGYASTRPVRKPSSSAPPSTAATHTNGVTPPAPPPPKTRTPYTLPDGSIWVRYPSGQWQQKGVSGWQKKPDISKAKAGSPENYQFGGIVDKERFGEWTPVKDAYGIRGLSDEGPVIGYRPGPPMPQPNPWPTPSQSPNSSIVRTGNPPPMPGAFGEEPPDISADANPYSRPRGTVDATERPVSMPSNPNPFAAAPVAMPAVNQPQNDFLDNPWIQAGLAAMQASGQRDARGLPLSGMAVIGAGGKGAMEQLQTRRENAMKQQSIAQAAKRLEAEAARHNRSITETERHNKATEDRQRETLDRENWQYLGPTADGSGIVMMNRRTNRIETKPVQVGAKPAPERPLGSTARKDLKSYGQTFESVAHLNDTFKDEYSGYGSPMVGDAANWIARQTGIGNKDAANWWQNHQRSKNEIRHGQFGSALTQHEKNEWDKGDVNPGTQPETIKANIKRQQEIALGAMSREALSLVKEGFKKDVIAAQLGVSWERIEKEGRKAEAIEWARNNSGDPRSKKIFEAHGIK